MKEEFRGLFYFTPKLPLNSIYLETHLVLDSQLTASVASTSNLVLDQLIRLPASFYFEGLSVVSRALLASQLPLNTIITWRLTFGYYHSSERWSSLA